MSADGKLVEAENYPFAGPGEATFAYLKGELNGQIDEVTGHPIPEVLVYDDGKPIRVGCQDLDGGDEGTWSEGDQHGHYDPGTGMLLFHPSIAEPKVDDDGTVHPPVIDMRKGNHVRTKTGTSAPASSAKRSAQSRALRRSTTTRTGPL